MMDVFSLLTPGVWLAVLAIAVVAGLVKGMVGFAMPLIMVAGFSSFMSPELALAGLLAATVVTNANQAMRQGFGEAVASVKAFKLFLIVGAVVLLIAAQMIRVISPNLMLGLIGAFVTMFLTMQLVGWVPKFEKQNKKAEVICATIAGLAGGVSGVWGPPTVLYLTALNTEKKAQVRILGVIFFLGAVLLIPAHIASGVLTWKTAMFSLIILPAALIGVTIGVRIQNTIDQKMFRKATMIVLLITGLNLLRRAFFG